MTSLYSNDRPDKAQSNNIRHHDTPSDKNDAEQRWARDAVMEIDLFPDLTRELRKAFGYGPHVDMLQHFVYWFHPRHPKMQDRWTLYKTYAEWRDECGLARKQVDKGREKLRDLGFVTEKKGPRARIFYRIDWVALAQLLSLSPVGEQTDELDGWFFDDEDEFSLSPVGEQGQFVPQGEQASLSPVGEHANSGEYSGEYLQENSLLQSAAEPAFAEPAAQQKNGKGERFFSLPPDHHPQGKRPLPPGWDPYKQMEADQLLNGYAGDGTVARFVRHHIEGRRDRRGEAFTLERVAEKLASQMDGSEPIDLCVAMVERFVRKELKGEVGGAA